jgi:hypothetical protein
MSLSRFGLAYSISSSRDGIRRSSSTVQPRLHRGAMGAGGTNNALRDRAGEEALGRWPDWWARVNRRTTSWWRVSRASRGRSRLTALTPQGHLVTGIGVLVAHLLVAAGVRQPKRPLHSRPRRRRLPAVRAPR